MPEGHSSPAAPSEHRAVRRRIERLYRPLVVIDRAEDVIHYIVALLLLVIAVIALYRTIDHLIVNRDDFAVQVTSGINDLLFVVIVLELLRTVVAHLATGGFQAKSFLLVGIIAAVRHIVDVGARLTLYAGQASTDEFYRSQIELGVGAGVVLALSLGLLLISKTGVE
jgi:uncharacterized membrane protein (DUF373 family)